MNAIEQVIDRLGDHAEKCPICRKAWKWECNELLGDMPVEETGEPLCHEGKEIIREIFN